jgi:hypothetical protein
LFECAVCWEELTGKLSELERKIGTHDEQIQVIFEAIHKLMAPPEPKKRKIDFLVEEKPVRYGKRKAAVEAASVLASELNRMERLEPGQWIWGEVKWNAFNGAPVLSVRSQVEGKRLERLERLERLFS